MNSPVITYETVELRCLCGELTVCVARGAVNIAVRATVRPQSACLDEVAFRRQVRPR